MSRQLQELQAWNLAHGLCPDCGGSGVVADMAKINRTGDIYINRKCRTCKGTGKPKQIRIDKSQSAETEG